MVSVLSLQSPSMLLNFNAHIGVSDGVTFTEHCLEFAPASRCNFAHTCTTGSLYLTSVLLPVLSLL